MASALVKAFLWVLTKLGFKVSPDA